MARPTTDLTFTQKLDALEAGARHANWEQTLAKLVGGALKALFGDIELDLDKATVKSLVEKTKELVATNADKVPAMEAMIDAALELYGRETSYQEMERKIRDSLKTKLGLTEEEGWQVWVTDMYPTYFVYEWSGKTYSIAYTFKDDVVEFGEPQEVKRVWVPAKEDAPTPVGQEPVVEGAAPAPTPTAGSEQMEVLETFQGMEAEFDDKSMKAIITIIKPGTSLNNRHYTEAAIASGFQLFEKAKMYINHPPKNQAAGPRGLESLTSAIRRTWVDEDSKSMKGEVKFFRKDFYEFVKEAKDDIGVSINALCAGQQNVMVDGVKVDLIEAFVRANSVDWVTDAGAGGGVDAILEGYTYTGEEQMTVLSEITLEQLKADRPDLVTKITEEATAPHAAVVTELEETKTRLTAMEAEVTAAKTAEAIRTILVAEERLPEKSRERLIKAFEGKTFEDGKLETDVKAAVEEELTYLGDLGVNTTTKPAPTTTKPTVVQNVGESAPTNNDNAPGTLNSLLDQGLGIAEPAKA